MAEVVSFEIRGLKELQKSLNEVTKKYPKETEKEIYRLAGLFTKDVNARMNFKSGDGDSLKKGWHRKRQKNIDGATEAVEIWNTSRKFHLLEHGHEVRFDPKHYAAFKAGKLDKSKPRNRFGKGKKNPNLVTRGFAPGLHFTEDTRNEWGNDKFNRLLQTYLDKMLKSENL